MLPLPMSDAATGDEWFSCMRRGDLPGAWRVSDRLLHDPPREREWERPRHEQRVWDGTPVAGRRVLVRCYHGLGDTIQFARYIPLVRAVAREVTVWAQPQLIPLLATIPGAKCDEARDITPGSTSGSTRGALRLLPLHDGDPGVECDVDVEIMELAHVFRSTLRTLPAEVPYLHVEPASRPRGEGRLRVGLVWEAGGWDERRSIPVELLAPLADVPGVELHVLQRGAALRRRPADLGIMYGSDDVKEAARAMRALDLVVTVDSMPAHLAGSLGVPVWTLLHADADWRWMEGRDDSPWYPTMRLFRQERPGEWGAVVARVAAELARRARG